MSVGLIEQAISEAGFPAPTPRALEQLDVYLGLLLKWNARLNLTAIRDPEAIIRRHFLECLQCAQNLPELPESATLLDFGSGAGLPGIPIAICRPEIRVTLAESQRKKAAFLREAVRNLELTAEVFDGRVEEMPPSSRFSAIALRAVDRMAEACRAALPRVAPKGWLILFTTRAAKVPLKGALPEIEGWQEIALSGMERGLILLGQTHQ
ncbi:MAG TPA: 16S rRNA (guanine(527)-N(7))-methyltransferase RsmG [Acidobacteriaceae bacterium]|nr:16S rRNA (guanine(527)-N(7))-methyltransferase RsmG [Acidobacteriaceae bacterium]